MSLFDKIKSQASQAAADAAAKAANALNDAAGEASGVKAKAASALANAANDAAEKLAATATPTEAASGDWQTPGEDPYPTPAETAPDAGQAAGASAGDYPSVSVVFDSMPETLAEFAALPQAGIQSPFDTAALFVAALCVYPLNKDASNAMIKYLRGPNPAAVRDPHFIRDRMAQNNKAPYLGASYLDGAAPGNDYTPSEPFTVTVDAYIYSYTTEGMAKLLVKSGGADSPRPISMRLAKDGKWYLWEFSSLLVDIRPPESTNPWA